MKILVAIVVFLLVCAAVWAQTVTVPVQSYVPDRQLTDADWKFILSVPPDGGLREAVRQMRQAGVVDIPSGGVYIRNTSADYWRMYQVWTATYRAEIPVAKPLEIPPLPPLETVTAASIHLEPIELQLQPVGTIETVGQPVCRQPVPCQLAGGSVAISRPGEKVETPIAGLWWWNRHGITSQQPSPPPSQTCPPGQAPTPPPPGNTTPPATNPPVGNGGGWNGPNQPPNQPVAGGVDNQPWQPSPPAAQ